MTESTTISFYCYNCGDLRDATHLEYRSNVIRFFCEECKTVTTLTFGVEIQMEGRN